MNVAVVGAGYVGLVTGVCLAARGHAVTCLDIDQSVVDRLNRGEPHIHERGLSELLATVIRKGRFNAQIADPAAFWANSIVMIAVGTPTVDGRIDLAYVGAAAARIGEYMSSASEPLSVVVKSTVLPGTTDTFVRDILQKHLPPGRVVGLGMNPEFLREGEAIEDFMEPDRIVLGYEDEATLAQLHSLYESWSCDKLEVNTRTAEMIKYANNCLLATQISAINELANLAGAIGDIDVRALLEGVHSDRRWNPIGEDGRRANPGILRYLIPGGGFGGSCFPKDVQAIRTLGRSLKLPMSLLEAVLEVNEGQSSEVAKILESHIGDLSGRRLLVLGLAFKPGTDDVRESPSLRLIRELEKRGAQVVAHDPFAGAAAAAGCSPASSVVIVEEWHKEIACCDGVVVATAWPEYAALREESNRALLQGKILVDTRSLLRAEDFDGVEYRTIGGSRRARSKRPDA